MKKQFLKKCATCNNDFNPGRHKEKLNCSDICLKKYKEEHKEERLKKSKEGVFKKHGVEHISKIKGFSDKVKSAKLKKYGDENYNNRDKAKNTNVEKYGVENSMKLDVVKTKSKQTKKEKYGDENYNNRDKASLTIRKKYGVDHHLQLDSIIKKQKETNQSRYGVSCSLLTEYSKKNLIKSNMKKYGSKYYFSSFEYLKETKENKIDRLRSILNDRKLSVLNNFDSLYSTIRNKNELGKLEYKKYEIKCQNCGNIFLSRVVDNALVCRVCYPVENGSKIQKEFEEYLYSIFGVDLIVNDRKKIKPHELDFYIDKEKVAIELNGNYYHSEISGRKNKQYHVIKSEKCQKNDIKCIHIFEDEWLLKNDIVKSRLNNLFGNTEKNIYARTCEIRVVEFEEKANFLDKNHIQGNCVDKIRIGLFYKNELVSLMTFGGQRRALGNSRIKDEKTYELIRFCSVLNTNVVGGFEKLLSHFIKTHSPKKIITYADCRWSGIDPRKTVYDKSGFVFIKRTTPSYYYLNAKNYLDRKHRFTLNKNRLIELYGGDKSKTEFELALENGFDRIWDCGSMKFEMSF